MLTCCAAYLCDGFFPPPGKQSVVEIAVRNGVRGLLYYAPYIIQQPQASSYYPLRWAILHESVFLKFTGKCVQPQTLQSTILLNGNKYSMNKQQYTIERRTLGLDGVCNISSNNFSKRLTTMTSRDQSGLRLHAVLSTGICYAKGQALSQRG